MRWKNPIRWTLLVLGSLLLVALVGGYVLIHTEAFNRFVAREIVEKAQESAGAQVSIGRTLIDWGRLKIDFYNVALRTPGKTDRPFFSCDHLRVGLKILSFWKRKIDLADIVLDRPVLRVSLDSTGRTNLPHPATPTSPTSASPLDKLFDLAVGDFELNSGQIDYNDQQVPLSAELRDLRMKVQFNVAAQSYQGSLVYHHGRIAVRKLTPFEHEAHMGFVAARSKFSIDSLVLSTGNTRLSAQAVLTDYVHPRVQGSYQAEVFTPDLARVLNDATLPVGEVRTAGSLRYESRFDQPILNSVSVDGRIDAPALDVETGGISAQARRIRGNYTLRNGNLGVQNLVAEVLGGSLHASFSMLNLATQPSSRLNASLRGASLADLTRAVPSNQREGIGLVGRTDALVEASWTGHRQEAIAHVRAAIYGPLAPASPKLFPVNGLIDLRYDGPRDSATFAPSSIRTANTQISMSGVLGNRSSLIVQASAHDLREISQLVASVSAASENPKSGADNSLDLRGSANFVGQILGSPKNPQIRGRLTGSDISAEGTAWRAVQADVDLSSSGLSLQKGNLKGSGQTQLTLNGRVGLQNWSFTPTSPVSLEANASAVSVTDLERIAKLRCPVVGSLNAKVSLDGSEAHPAGQASVDISNGSAWGESVKRLTIRLRGDDHSVSAAAQMQIPAGLVSAALTYAPKSQRYDVRIDAPKLTLNQIQLPRSSGLKVDGTAAMSASGKGTIQQPQLSATFEIPQLHIQDQTISQLRAQLNVVNQHANFTLNSTVIGGYAQAKGDVDLRGNYFTTASVDVRALPISPLLASYLPQASSGLQGRTEVHASLNGPLKQRDQINAQVQIPTLDLAYQSVHLGLTSPMKLDYAHGVLTIEKADLKGNGTELSLRGTVPVKTTQPLNVAADGVIDLGLIQGFTPNVKSSGQVNLHLTAQGGVSRPAMQGQIRIANAMFSSETVPLSWEGVNGKIRLAGDRIEIDQLDGTAGGGHISAKGFLAYGQRPTFNLSVQAKSVRIRYPEGIRSILDANLDLTGTPDSSSLSGRVLADRLSFTQQFDMAHLMSQGSETSSTAPPAFEQNMKLNIAIASTQELNVTSSKLSVGGSANLTIAGNLADPVILGRVALTQGEVFFMGKRYEIQNSTIAFANPVRTEPVLNLYAKTTVQQYNITLNFVGPIDRLRTIYTSDPPLPQSDIINLIAFGQTAEQAATSPSTPASVGAESVLAQGLSSQVSGKVEQIAGISQITIDPLVTNSQANPGSQVAIQQRVSGSLLLTFSTDVTSTQAQTVEVQYRMQKNVTISVLRDENGGYAVDARIHKVF
jgi:translocation and assembly module TamB